MARSIWRSVKKDGKSHTGYELSQMAWGGGPAAAGPGAKTR
jgi:hypothetical protein